MEHRELMLMFSDLFDTICNEVAKREGWNEETDWNEHVFIPIESFPYCDSRIDGVLFFADGTVEFHEDLYHEALSWCYFSIGAIEQVLERLKPKFEN